MLKVAAEARKSAIHGLGLFAKEFIPKGTLVWAFDEGFDKVHTVEEVVEADEAQRHFLLTYAYFCKKLNGYILCGDEARFVNHSENPCIASIVDGRTCHAIRDIYPDEELMEDYRTYDEDPLQQWSDLLFNPHAVATPAEGQAT